MTPEPEGPNTSRKKKAGTNNPFSAPTPPAPAGVPVPDSKSPAISMMPTDNICASASTSLSDAEHAIELSRLREELAEIREEMRKLLVRMHEPLLVEMIRVFEFGMAMSEHPRAFARMCAEASGFRDFVPLLELKDCEGAEESVRAAWKSRKTGRKKRLLVAEFGSEEWWHEIEVAFLGFNPEGMTVLKQCVLTGDMAVRDRRKKARKPGRGRERKAKDLILWQWLTLGLWLFHEDAAVALLRAVHGMEVWPETYNRYVRELGLYRRRPPAINMGVDLGLAKKLYLTRGFQAELRAVKGGGITMMALETVLSR